jgi:hypothetical protein
MSEKLKVPDNITLLPLPPRSPELKEDLPRAANDEENCDCLLRNNSASTPR